MKRDKAKVMNDLKEFIDDIPVELHLNSERTKKFVTFLNKILGFLACDEEIIKKLTEENVRLHTDYNELYELTTEELKEKSEQIFKLENRLKECENGYEGTLYLERCKLHDAEEKNKKLTEENERLKERLEREAKCQYDLCGQIVDLKAENERLRADTVREVAEMIKAAFPSISVAIDYFVKKMLEDK